MHDAACPFSARMSTLPALLAHARLRLQTADVPQDVVNRVELVLEELFTNSVVHGYCGGDDTLVWLDVKPEKTAVKLVYADAAPPYDPLEHEADLEYCNEHRAVGGLGVLLACRLADEIEYRFVDGRNILALGFRIAT
jgi:anti-sigma regulatory factor (Ser/Thr protein kinase)